MQGHAQAGADLSLSQPTAHVPAPAPSALASTPVSSRATPSHDVAISESQPATAGAEKTPEQSAEVRQENRELAVERSPKRRRIGSQQEAQLPKASAVSVPRPIAVMVAQRSLPQPDGHAAVASADTPAAAPVGPEEIMPQAPPTQNLVETSTPHEGLFTPPASQASRQMQEPLVEATNADEAIIPPLHSGATMTPPTQIAETADGDASVVDGPAAGPEKRRAPKPSADVAQVKRRRRTRRATTQEVQTNGMSPETGDEVDLQSEDSVVPVSADGEAGEPNLGNDAPAGTGKKPRRTRKDKGKPRAPRTNQSLPAEGGQGDAAASTATQPQQKRRQKRAPVGSGSAENGQAVAEDGTTTTRRRGRPRSPTPPGAEEVTIDTSKVTMDELTKDHPRGQLSEIEKQMRTMDWDEILRRRREEARELIVRPTGMTEGERHRSEAGRDQAECEVEKDQDEGALSRNSEALKAIQAAKADMDEEGDIIDEDDDNADGLDDLEREINQGSQGGGGGLRMRMINGHMELDPETVVVDRRAQAALNDAAAEEIEENDLTKHITRFSFLNARRRDPAERTRGLIKSDRWGEDETNRFYDALRMFGTDFFIISKMFPGKTRRHIKKKFVREERADPERVNKALVGGSVKMSMSVYMEETMTEESMYKDPKAVQEELDREAEDWRERIETAKKETEELERQKKLAGGEAEGGKKGKRKKKGREAPRAGGEEIEVLEEIVD